ncbi:MAG: ABC transporter permease subunit [Burkholderiales bacterium]|nr:ABC transporter permease subunit [Burkholderiales bacterium]
MDTRKSVVWAEFISRWAITLGGLLVIVAVLTIMVFLFWVAVPLIGGGKQVGSVSYALPSSEKTAWLYADEFQTIGIRVGDQGEVLNFHIPSGQVISRSNVPFEGRRLTASAGTLERDRVLLGFDDGSVQFMRLRVETRTTPGADFPQAASKIDGRDFQFEDSVYTRVLTGDYRTLRPLNEVGASEKISDLPIVAVDYRVGGTVERPTIAFATVDANAQVRVSQSRVQRNMMTGAEIVRTETTELPSMNLKPGVKVTSVLLSGSADRAIVATNDGVVYRYDLRDPSKPILAESKRILPEGVAITAMTFLGGEATLVVGGSDSTVAVFFWLQIEGSQTGDGFELVQSRLHDQSAVGAVLGLSEAQRDKSFVAIDDKGNVRVTHSTSDQVLFGFKRSGDPAKPVTALIFPRSDGVLLVSDTGQVNGWQYEDPHPEITLKVLFGKIWYEGYNQPEWIWQSTAGTDLSEPKFSLVPLIFGTIKAAFYAMLFGAPIALLAAIYTSEFIHRSVRATVKPLMETMESLPTVILGFIAALVLAPLVEEWIGAVLLGFIAVPMGLMLGAFIWQTLPHQTVVRYDGMPKFLLISASIVLSVYVSIQLGPLFEIVLFYGDFKAWTTGIVGTGTPFMFLILLPLSYVAVSILFSRYAGQLYKAYVGDRERTVAGRLDMLRWLGLLLAAAMLSLLLASLLTLLGYDPRGGFIDSYQQRNALVVGFVMAFAVIPNIYTLAEDALSSVPGHLRAGSLACGATPWQTAMWIILPTAASGVFSALMMGMGRAVGETMIVVMAAGNTPVMEWNVFSGLRTLSANIAIELGEAVKDGTNYRVLFLAALTLFIMTFFINTIAELIRQRFRKRAFQL